MKRQLLLTLLYVLATDLSLLYMIYRDNNLQLPSVLAYGLGFFLFHSVYFIHLANYLCDTYPDLYQAKNKDRKET